MNAAPVTAPVIALDVMGGDAGLADVMAAAEIASERYPRLTFRLHGPEPRIRAELARCPRLAATAQVIHTDDVVLGTALAAKAEMIVTGDRPFLSVRRYQNIDVLTVSDALIRIEDC